MSSRVQKKATAREKAAQVRAEQLRAERRRRVLLAAAAVVLVLVVAGGLVAAKLAGVGDGGGSATPAGRASAQVVSALSSVPGGTLDTIGTGAAQGGPKKIDAPALSKDGKPRVLYVGAEFCPYCAAERWPVAVALSRFGTFTDLGATTSASEDQYPSTATLSFHGARYDSSYLSFTGVETTTNQRVGNNYAPLDSLTATDQKIVDTYNQTPYVSRSGAIPFVDIGGTYVSSGATYDPQVLAGKTHAEIAAALKDPDSDIAKSVDGVANTFTAALCKVTDGKPGDVCSSSGVTEAAASLGSNG